MIFCRWFAMSWDIRHQYLHSVMSLSNCILSLATKNPDPKTKHVSTRFSISPSSPRKAQAGTPAAWRTPNHLSVMEPLWPAGSRNCRIVHKEVVLPGYDTTGVLLVSLPDGETLPGCLTIWCLFSRDRFWGEGYNVAGREGGCFKLQVQVGGEKDWKSLCGEQYLPGSPRRSRSIKVFCACQEGRGENIFSYTDKSSVCTAAVIQECEHLQALLIPPEMKPEHLAGG